ncbi:hypothetical protein TWF694_009639 [Orbilia ellipsospora]|uniref:FCP1 homology domain-containing protein n=1 Tax=Orbilia ellipsospora TaxID=2528407 RepID=A0AAV9XE42_9PEZI
MSQQPTDSGMPLADSSSANPHPDSLLVPSRPNSKNQHSSPTSTATTANNASLVEENEAAKGSKRRRSRGGDGASVRSSGTTKTKKGGFFSSLFCCRTPDAVTPGNENVRKADRNRVGSRDNQANVPAAIASKSKEERTEPVTNQEPLSEKVVEPSEEASSANEVSHAPKVIEEPPLAKSSTESTNGEARFPRTTEIPTTPPPPAPEAPANNSLPPAIIQEQQQTQGTSSSAEAEYPAGPSVTHTPPTPHPDEGKSDEGSLATSNSAPKEDKRKSTSSVRPTTPIETDESDAEGSLDQDAGAAEIGMHPVPVPADPLLPGDDAKSKWLLPPIAPEHQGKKCLVLDLDETLVHSSFRQLLQQPDFTIPVEIEGSYHNIYVIKRPGVDQFMKRVGELYEVVVFTASVSKYGDPLLDQLDIHSVVHHRLFRDSCYNHQGNYVKDLSQLGRDLKDTIIIDNSPTSYIFHPQHALPVSSWFSDAHDNELLDLIPVLEDLATTQVRDVSLVLDVSL